MTVNGRGIRALRGFLLAGLSTFVAAFSHAAGGGDFPHPMLLVAGLLFSGIFCAALAGERASWARIAPSVLVSQLGFHLLFSTSRASGRLLVESGGHAGTSAHQASTVEPAGHAMHAMVVGDLMIVAHAVAAVVTIIAVRHGDAALRRITSAARLAVMTLLRIPHAVVVGAPTARVSAASVRVIAPRPPEFLLCIHHRGPPVLAAGGPR